MFTGTAYGDAAGAPYERLGSMPTGDDRKYSGKFVHGRIYKNRFQKVGREHFPGFVTDDTSMCFAAKKVVESGWTREKALLAYLEWSSGPFRFFMGRNTRDLFGGVKTIKGYESRVEKQKGEIAQGNGPLMRCAAFAILDKASECARIAREDCFLTNPNEASMLCCEIHVTCLFYATKGKSAEQIWKFVQKNWKDHPVVMSVANCDTLSSSEFSPNKHHTKGWILVALFCSLWAMKETITRGVTEDILTEVVCGSLDSDTTGAVVGALLGALGCQWDEENLALIREQAPWVFE